MRCAFLRQIAVVALMGMFPLLAQAQVAQPIGTGQLAPVTGQPYYGQPAMDYSQPALAYGQQPMGHGQQTFDPLGFQQASAVQPLAYADDIYADASGGGCEDGQCDGSCDGYYCEPARWVVGADFLYTRRGHNERKAFIRQLRPGPVSGVTTETDESIYFDADFASNFRTYVAYRLEDCCSELRVTYWSLNDSVSASATAGTGEFIEAWEIVATTGETLTSTNDFNGNILDLECSHCICSPCDCCCPSWDLAWAIGVRYADLKDEFSTRLTNSTNTFDATSEFIGAGPRVGLEGRRYFGAQSRGSVYGSFDASLLLGKLDHEATRVSANQQSIERFTASTTRIAPVIDLEVGVNYQLSRRVSVSGGWMFQAWWDVTATEEQLSAPTGAPFVRDDANITYWNGLTARIEASF